MVWAALMWSAGRSGFSQMIFQSFPIMISSRQVDIQVWISGTGQNHDFDWLGRSNDLPLWLQPWKVLFRVVGLRHYPQPCTGSLWDCVFLVHQHIKYGEIWSSSVMETSPYFTPLANIRGVAPPTCPMGTSNFGVVKMEYFLVISPQLLRNKITLPSPVFSPISPWAPCTGYPGQK